jgi:hypothetical protein
MRRKRAPKNHEIRKTKRSTKAQMRRTRKTTRKTMMQSSMRRVSAVSLS